MFDQLVVTDAPAWNATWAVLLVVAPIAWMVGAWLLPALDIRPRSSLRFTSALTQLWPGTLQPEPLEQQRFVLTLLATFAVVPCALLVARRRALDAVTRFAPPIGLVAVVAVSAFALVRGHDVAELYFSMGPVLAVVAAVVLAFAAASVFARPVRSAAVAVDRLSRRRSVEAVVLLVVLALAFGVMAVGLYTDGSVLLSPNLTTVHLQFSFEEATAVTYGRTPLVDFTPQYSALLSWLLAPLFLLKAPTMALFTATMVAIGMASLVCLYVTFRLVTGTAARALLLYVPAVAIGFVVVQRVAGWGIHSIAGYFALMPIRDAGPLALGLLCVWVASADRSRARAVLLGAASAATFLMNVEFGVVAVAAAAVAVTLLNRDERPPLRRTAILLGELAAGAVAVLVAFALLTLVRSGSLPDVGQLFYFQRQFAAAGFFLIPMDHLLGFHSLVFATSAATAITGLGIVAFGRVRSGLHGRRSAALLIYAGIFGLGVFEYYVGRTLPPVLSATFLSWGVALMALCWEAGCRVAAGGTTARAVRPAAAVLLVGATVLSVDAVRHLDYTVHQPARVFKSYNVFKFYTEPDATDALRTCVPRGSDVLILTSLPDRIAHQAGMHNWYPYDTTGSVVTTQQVDRMFDVAARHHVTAALTQYLSPGRLFAAHGFAPVRIIESRYGLGPTTLWERAGAPGAVDCHGVGRAPDFVTVR